MRVRTSDFKNNVKNMGRQINSRILVNDEVLEEELYSVTPHFQANILKSVMKELELQSSVPLGKGIIIKYELGVLVNGEYEYMDYGNYVVDSIEKIENKNLYKIKCYDKMLYSMKDYEELEITYPITIKNYFIAIGNKLGLNVSNNDFYNSNLSIQQDLYAGLGYTYRDVLDEIAQASGGIVCINENDELCVKYPTRTNDTIDEEYLGRVNVEFGQKYGPINSIVLSRAEGSDNIYIKDQASIEQNGLCEIKISDNQIMNWNDRDAYLPDLLTALGGFYYYINDFTSTGILYYELGDLYNVQIGNKTYQCCMLNDEVNVTSGLKEIIHTDMPEQSETDYTKADKTDRALKQTYLIVNKQNQKIEAVNTSVTEQNTKIASLSQTVAELNSKISDISDITVYGESGYASIQLTDVNTSEPIMLKVRPTTESISKLYPHSNLYPSSSLYMKTRTIRFIRTYQDEQEVTRTENIDYELPDNLLFYNNEVYDEFILDLKTQTCQITKRCGYNADGSVYALATEVVNNYTYPTINLDAGDYEIKILGYNYGYIFARLMASNIYTSQFVTKVEETSDIRQAKDEIDISVNQKLSNYSTTVEMYSAINARAGQIELEVGRKMDEEDFNGASIILAINNDNTGSVLINGDKIDIDGKAVHFKTNITERKGPYTQADVDRIRNIIMGQITPTENDFDKYDINEDRRLDSIDLYDVLIAINRNNGYIDASGTFEINPYTMKKCIALWNDDINNYSAILSLNGNYFDRLATTYITLDDGEQETASYVSPTAIQLNNDKMGITEFLNSSINDVLCHQIEIAYGQDGSTKSAINMYALANNKAEITLFGDGGGYTDITNNGITTPKVTQTSKESVKKNIEKYDEKALKIVENSDIYKYNYKYEDDTDKKHIGFVIGDKGGNYKTPYEVISQDEEGIDSYTMTSILWKAVQELEEENKQLTERLEVLEGK